MFDMMMMTGATVNEMLEVCGVSPEEFYGTPNETEEPEIEEGLFWCQNGADLDKVLEDIQNRFPSVYVYRTLAEMDTSRVFIQCLEDDFLPIFNMMDKVAMEF